jgi:hypothetical protein
MTLPLASILQAVIPTVVVAVGDTASQASLAATTWKTVAATAVPYLITGALGWLGSSLRLGRKIRRSDKANKEHADETEKRFTHALTELTERVTEQLETMKSDIDERLHASTTRIDEIAQEVWGAQKTNGMRGDIRKLKQDSEQQGKVLAGIDAKVDMLIARSIGS